MDDSDEDDTPEMSLEDTLKKLGAKYPAIDLSGISFTDESVRKLAGALGRNTFLKSLEMTGCDLDDGFLRILCKPFLEHPLLNHIDLCANEFGDEGAAALAGVMKQKPALRVYYHDNKIGPDGAAALMEAIQLNHQDYLDMGGNPLGNEGVERIAPMLGENRHIEDIWLDGANLSDPAAKALAKALEANTRIECLDLKNNDIGDEGAIALAAALKRNQTLYSLNLEDNEVGDKGAIALAEMLKHNSMMNELHLHHNNIGDKGRSALREAAAASKNLLGLFDDDPAVDAILESNREQARQLLTKLMSGPDGLTRDDCGELKDRLSAVICTASDNQIAIRTTNRMLRMAQKRAKELGVEIELPVMAPHEPKKEWSARVQDNGRDDGIISFSA